jgi:WD40 repeat protein
MLYSAKIISLNENKNFDELLTDKMIASGTIYNQILLWNPKNGSITASLEGHQGVIFNIDFCYENSMIFSVSDDRSINVWKIVFNEGQFDKNESKLSTRFYGKY